MSRRVSGATQADALSSSDISTRTDLIELKTDIIKWIVGIALAQVGLLFGILIKLLTLVH